MLSLRSSFFDRKPFQVLSLSVQAAAAPSSRRPSPFEVLVRHLLDRMLHNEALGEDAASRVAQLAYAVALPGMLIALFLFPAYHGLPPHPLERSFWSQAADHLFFVTYSLVIVGLAMVFQWNALFPDVLDLYILSSLPLTRARLLLGRVAAMAIFLGLLHLGTSGLGSIFLPAVADLRCGFARHLFAHVASVSLAALFAAAAFVTLQGLLTCVLRGRLLERSAAALKAACVVVLLTLLFLFPLTAHFLPTLLTAPSAAARWVPTFWFLAVYEILLAGPAAPHLFFGLAKIGCEVTATLSMLSALLYPIAYTRSVAGRIEGASAAGRKARSSAWFGAAAGVLFVRTAAERAIFFFTWQTLLRLDRLQLYLSMYAGLGLALALSALLAFQLQGAHASLVLAQSGLRVTTTIISFWAVFGLRSALLSPVGQRGSWIFPVISGAPRFEQIQGASALVSLLASALSLLAAMVLDAIVPPGAGSYRFVLAQALVCVGSSLLLTDLIFLTRRAIPFTESKKASTEELPLLLVACFVGFPLWVSFVLQVQLWAERSILREAVAAALVLLLHWGLLRAHAFVLSQARPSQDLVLMDLGFRLE